jgi:hypothetical protein
MSIIKDARGNEFLGSLDQIGGGTITDARVANATLSALNAELVMDLNGQAVAVFDLRTAAMNATLVFEATVDGTNYIGLPGINVATEAMLAAVIVTTTHGAAYVVGVSGFRRVRCRVSAYSTGNIVVTGRASQSDFAIYARPVPSQLHVTATAAVNTGSTATLGAAGAGLFHYITRIQLVKLYSVVGVAAGAGVIITSTNLPGNPSWTTEQLASPAGTAAKVIDEIYHGNPLKSSAPNTATTLVAPAQLQTIWRWNVSYYVGA